MFSKGYLKQGDDTRPKAELRCTYKKRTPTFVGRGSDKDTKGAAQTSPHKVTSEASEEKARLASSFRANTSFSKNNMKHKDPMPEAERVF